MEVLNHYLEDACTPIFIATLFTIANTWKSSKCPSTHEWIKKIGIWIHICNAILISCKKKKGNLATCDIMNGTWQHHAKWDNSDWERQILYDFTYMWNHHMWNLKIPNSKKQRLEWWLPGPEYVEVGEMVQTEF